jgi:hypothetical protein
MPASGEISVGGLSDGHLIVLGIGKILFFVRIDVV